MAIMVRKEMPGLFWAIVALVVLLPLPLGAVYQWSWGLMACVVGAVLAVWSARVALGFPAGLFDALLLRTYAEAFAAALQVSRARDPIAEVEAAGAGFARYVARW